MIIGIFSKFEMAGGSEKRCYELARGITKYSDNTGILLSEKSLPKSLLSSDLKFLENCIDNPRHFDLCDVIIVVNTDSRDFCTKDYWLGKSIKHNKDISNTLKDKKIWFLFNFIVSPSRYLNGIKKLGAEVGIFTANKKFFDEISKQDRYENIRDIPRYQLNSPIDPYSVTQRIRKKKQGEVINIGFHSKGMGNKWNDDIPRLVEMVNSRYGEQEIKFVFMGIKSDLPRKLSPYKNVKCLKENQLSVKDFLDSLDIFMFFPSFKREEPWCRVIAEAMMSGLPIIATDKGGNCDQVLKENNGFLCKKTEDFFRRIVQMKENLNLIESMSKNSIRISKEFSTESVVKKLLECIL